ncbi:DNA-binding transcriptional repressor YiaJ [Tepidimonas alkaliphilus]|uniref:DNA-binding transcriptional repressor YiaJ n=2 Tax=Tepidimonas alkaliphilus TaxID=2588942 RepID=A0A554W8I6_9BURK|nr:DNA-binding transcriptional repressor YiaJ [Tepidimonas alkaliphilus]
MMRMHTLPPDHHATDSTAGDDGPLRRPRGIQSIEVGGQLLKALARAGRALPLKELARAAGMGAAKAHPYLVSFGKLGLVEQDPVSGHYGLGPLALQLGLIGLQQVDPVRLAVAELPALARTLGCTVSAAVWGPVGPIIVHVELAPTPVHVAMRHGMPASLRHTGTGKIFAAFGEPQAVAAALAREGEAEALRDPAFAEELAAIRREGLSRVRDELLPGISALAVPVFDGFGRVVLALAAIAPSALLDLRAEGAQAQALIAAGRRLTQRLGTGG